MRTRLLQLLTIQKPCDSSWDDMTGDSRMRFCSSCGKHVHNLSALTRTEAEALLVASGGKLCAKVERRPDGSILTLDDPAKSGGFRLPFPRGAGAALSAVLSVAPVAAQTQAAQQQVLKDGGQRSPVQRESSDSATLYGTVSDPTGFPISGAIVEVTGHLTGIRLKDVTDSVGQYRFEALPADSYTVTAASPGFVQFRQVIHFRAGQSLKLDSMLAIGSVGETVIIMPETTRQKIASFFTYPIRKLKRR